MYIFQYDPSFDKANIMKKSKKVDNALKIGLHINLKIVENHWNTVTVILRTEI